jgi:hypothetical protein
MTRTIIQTTTSRRGKKRVRAVRTRWFDEDEAVELASSGDFARDIQQ